MQRAHTHTRGDQSCKNISLSASRCRLSSETKDTVTFVLVSVQQVLKLCVEDLQVLLDQDLLTLSGQFVLGGFMEVNLHTPLLLQETGLRLRKRTQRKQTDSGHDSALKAPRVSARSPTAVCSWTAQRLPSSCTL